MKFIFNIIAMILLEAGLWLITKNIGSFLIGFSIYMFFENLNNEK